MTRTYKNPPILEAVCEFRFVLDKECNKNQISDFYESIKDYFPVQKKGRINKLEFKIEADKTLEENKKTFNQDFYEFEQFFSTDEKYFVQLDGSRVSIHRIKPYISWTDFLPLINNVCNSFIKVFSPVELSRIGIRYINEVIIPSNNFSFDNYFNIKASLPSLEKNSQMSLFLSSVFEQEDGRDVIKVQFSERPVLLGPTNTNRVFVLDFDYSLVDKTSVEFKSIDKWLKKAHLNLEGVFEGMITTKTKEIFDK